MLFLLLALFQTPSHFLLIIFATCHALADAQALVRFAAHIQQVDMESNGKRVSIDGATLSFECGVSYMLLCVMQYRPCYD